MHTDLLLLWVEEVRWLRSCFERDPAVNFRSNAPVFLHDAPIEDDSILWGSMTGIITQCGGGGFMVKRCNISPN